MSADLEHFTPHTFPGCHAIRAPPWRRNLVLTLPMSAAIRVGVVVMVWVLSLLLRVWLFRLRCAIVCCRDAQDLAGEGALMHPRQDALVELLRRAIAGDDRR
jgi:hypothetical protein